MKNARLFAIGLFLLSLNACQAPSQQLTPELSKKLDYSRQVTAAFKSYTKDSFEGFRQNPQLLSMGAGGASRSNVPSGADPLVNTFTATSQPVNGPARPAASATPAQPASLEEALKLLDLLKQLVKANDKAVQDMEARLKALTPPADIAAKHGKVLEYFRLSHEFCQDMLKLLDAGPAAASELSNAQSKFKERAEQLGKLGTEVQDFLYEVFLGGYRQDRLALQQGPALSRDTYILRMRALLPKLPASIDSPPRLFAEAQASGPRTEAQAALSELAALHPPEDFEESHTVLYAGMRLHQELIPMLQGVFAAEPDTQALTQKPIELMIKLLGNSELTGKLLEFATFASKTKQATSRIVRG